MGVANSLAGPGSIVGNFSGTWTSTGQINAANINNVLTVGAPYSWGGVDIGDDINKAYAALPANGGEIDIFPNASAACYNYSTPIVLAVAGKYVWLKGRGATSSTVPGSPAGLCLNYVPTTGRAITLDYVPQIGGGATISHGLSDLTLQNNGCTVTVGPSAGCGSSATGLYIGGTNSGIQIGVVRNVVIQGFATGVTLVNNGTAVPWGINFENVSWNYNNVGFHFGSTGIESTTFVNPKFLFNDTGIDGDLSGSDVNIYGGSIDSSASYGIHTTGTGILDITNTHFENPGPTTTHYISTGCQHLPDWGLCSR